MTDIIILGAGPAGLMAGISAAKEGKSVIIIEHMNDVAKKLLITGKGRCNITNSCDIADFIKNIPGNGKFLYSAFKSFGNEKLINFFNENNLETKVERGGRVFPTSDRAIDVKNTLLNIFKKLNGSIKLNTSVKSIIVENESVKGVRTDTDTFLCQKVIVATGGASYPKTGSDGSGFYLAKNTGHNIVDILPALVPLESDFLYLNELQGLSLKNVSVSLLANEKTVKKEFGEMLFTHFGVSGPVILTMSNLASFHLKNQEKVEIVIDFKPALTYEALDKRICRDFEKFSRKQIKNSFDALMPKSLIPVIIKLAEFDENKFTHQITREERKKILNLLKSFHITITKTRPLAEAIVTSGGVNTKEVDPKTMKSKLVEGLYFAGEVLDIDGYTGGFNLQAAFSTGYVAGFNAAKSCYVS